MMIHPKQAQGSEFCLTWPQKSHIFTQNEEDKTFSKFSQSAFATLCDW